VRGSQFGAVPGTGGSPLWASLFLLCPRPVCAQISADLPASRALDALQHVAQAASVPVIASPLPDGEQAFSLQNADLDTAVTELARVYNIDVTMWRGILIAEPPVPGTLRDHLRDAVTPDEAALLFRPPDDGSYDTPGFELVRGAIKALATEGHTDKSKPLLEQTALWRAGPELQQHIANVENALAGNVLVSMAPPEKWETERGDYCAQHLVLLYPGSGDPKDVLGSQTARFHARGYDRFAETLKMERATIGREELVRRLVQRARAQEDPLGGDERLSLPVFVSGAITLTELARRAGETIGMRIDVEDALRDQKVFVEAEGVRAGDILHAAARLTRGAIALREEAGTVSLCWPGSALERVDTALPLPLWALAHLTSIEADLWCQEQTDSAWASLMEDQSEALARSPVRIESLGVQVRSLALYHFARSYRLWTQNLPLRDGPVPLWLYERTDEPRFWGYELRAPGGSEFVKGIGYLLLKGELRDDPLYYIAAPAEGGGEAR